MVSIIVCTYNREKYLQKVFDSIITQNNHGLVFEVVIIDNNSPDNTKQVSLNFINSNPQIDARYVLETRQGISFGRSRGFEEAKYKYVAYSDDDAYYADNYFEELENFILTNPNVAAFGGKVLLDYEANHPPKWESKYISSILGYFNKGDVEHKFTNDYARGANMIFTKELISKVNGFNTDLGRTGGNLNGGEEKEIAEKIYKIGVDSIYTPKLIVYHAVPIFRTKNDFVKRQAKGIGYSERVRTKSYGTSFYISRWLTELFKWGATFVLWFVFLVKGAPAKGTMLIKFRYWVSLGLAGKFYE
jgi:glycosyltransferase involved in cell wall biosynthesis